MRAAARRASSWRGSSVRSASCLDLLLPGLDGWDLLARTKADPDLARVPVIIVSMLDERGRGLALGAADYLVKPISRAQLLDVLPYVTASHGTVLTIDDDPLALDLAEAVLEPPWATPCSRRATAATASRSRGPSGRTSSCSIS